MPKIVPSIILYDATFVTNRMLAAIPIAIIEKKRLNYYQQLLEDCNIEAHLITSELFGLEMIKNTIRPKRKTHYNTEYKN